MKPHITNLKHKKFSLLIEETIQKTAQITDDEKAGVAEKITELESNKDALDGIYGNYQHKLRELSDLLDEYERVQQASRIRLRKMQLWLKFKSAKLMKEIF